MPASVVYAESLWGTRVGWGRVGQDCENRAESWSSASRFGDSAKMSASAIRRFGLSRVTWAIPVDCKEENRPSNSGHGLRGGTTSSFARFIHALVVPHY